MVSIVESNKHSAGFGKLRCECNYAKNSYLLLIKIRPDLVGKVAVLCLDCDKIWHENLEAKRYE